MRNNTSTARAPNKRTFYKLGAVAAAAMLGVGAFSFFDTAAANSQKYEFGAWTDTSITQTTSTGNAPDDPDGYYEDDNPANTSQWVLQGDGPTYPNPVTETETYPGMSRSAPPADSMTEQHGDDVTNVGEWTKVEGSGKDVYTPGEQVLVRTYVYNMRGNPRLAPGESPAPDHPDWGRMGGFPSHAQGRAPGEIYNVSNNNQGNASWFMIGGEYEQGPDVYSHTDYVWQRQVTRRGDPVWTWVLQERDVTRIELPAYYWIRQNWNSRDDQGGRDTAPPVDHANWGTGQRDTVTTDAPAHAEFEAFQQGEGSGSWFRWVRIDGDAWRDGRIVLYTEVPN